MILGTGASAVKEEAMQEPWLCFSGRALRLNKVLRGMHVLALLLCLCVNSWAACVQVSSGVNGCIQCSPAYDNPSGTTNCLSTTNGGTCTYTLNPSEFQNRCTGSNSYPYPYYSQSGQCDRDYYNSHHWACSSIALLCCDSQAEADSMACVSQGNTWIPQHQNSQGVTIPGKCQEPVQEDQETMEKLVSACDQLDGEPNYRYNDDGNVVGYCNLCQKDENGNYTNTHVKEAWKEYQESCCQVGKAPSDKSFSCVATANACVGANCDWTITPGAKGGGIGYSDFGFKSGICVVNVSVNPSTGTIAGCEDDQPGSSGSGESSPSSSGSSDSGVSSSGTNDSSASMEENTQLIADGVGAIIDSLHKIIVIDSMNRTYDSLVAVFTSTIASLVDEINQKEIGGGDTTIINIPRDTNVVNVNVGQAAVVSAIENMSAENQQIATKILAESDTSNELLKGILGALDTSKYNDSNLVKILTDTTGSGGDTAGWGRKLDSLGDWLKDSTIIKNIFGSGSGAMCDTTGGKKCNMAGSLDSAGGSWGTTYKALGDSLTQGAIGDSLAHWESMLTNNGVITGSGSNACPSVFSRQFNIQIGSGINVQTPALGQYICANIPGTSVTFWTLARVVIRAMVAITCMWWLYGAVTGVRNDGGDDD